MNMNSKLFYITLITFIFFNQILFAQTQLLQSFSEENTSGNSFFGRSVANGGDLNNDGVNDLVVGANGYNTNMGRVQIYFGGSTIDDVMDIAIVGENQNDNFGQSVSTGDFNGDGIDDLIVGAYGYYANRGRVYIYYGGTTFNNVADLTIDGENISDQFGFSVSTAGNVNNDNYDDIIVGASVFNGRTGKAYIYFGGNPMNSFANVVLNGENLGDSFGHSVSMAGDINNDNYDDVVVGAYGYNSWTGRAYVFYGGSSMNNTADLFLDGENANDNFGYSVSHAGDVNNDNYDDIIIGAFGYSSATGRVYLFHGGSSPNNISDLIFEGEGINNSFGYAISNAGDINNDGYSDLLIGALLHNSATGKSYIYYGGSAMNIVPDLILIGEDLSNQFGNSVANLGDVNDDGFDDLAIAAHTYKGQTGKVYLLFGSNSPDNVIDLFIKGPGANNSFGNSVSSAGDVNNDGYNDVVVGAVNNAYLFLGGSTVDNLVDLQFNVESTFGYYFTPVSFAGDVNNDGYDDIIIGSSGYDSNTGRAYIFLGGNPMDNVADIILTGFYSNSFFGRSVSSAGDVNNDNFDDVIVGMNGRAYVFYGGSSMNNIHDLLLTETIGVTRFGESVSYAGDVNNDGFDDVIVGDIGVGKTYIYFGASPMNNVVDITISIPGKAVSTAGDVNDDGFDDVIIGHNGENNPANGIASILFGGNPMDNITDVGFQLFELNTANKFGYSVSTAGDINHDNFDDVIVGASGYNNDAGRAYIYYGGSTMDNIANIILDGENVGDNFGISVSDAGDVNYDGYEDMIIGSSNFPINGKSYLYSTSSAPLFVVRASIKIFLEGPYNSNNMNNNLDLSNTLIQPYHNLPWNYLGGEKTTQSFITNNNIVDWVLLELRTGSSASEATAVVSSRAALLRNDGVILDTDGSDFISFPQTTAGDYYLTVYHRNHLPIITNQAITLSP